MTTALATTNEAIATVSKRIASMMQLPADVPDDVIWAAAQLAVAHRLNPFTGEIYIMDTGSKKVGETWVPQYRAHIGVKGLRTIARRQANFTMSIERLDDAEVQRLRRDMYHPDDIGMRCTLWRLDVARECRDAGVPYHPTTAVGLWRKEAQLRWKNGKQTWAEDNIPNTWTAEQVAEKRAEINAIKIAYDLAVDVADPAAVGDDVVLDEISWRVASEERDRAMPANRPQLSDDGLFIEEPTRARGNGAQGPSVQATEHAEEPPTAREAKLLAKWQDDEDAKRWALQLGTCANEYEAQNSWDKQAKSVGDVPNAFEVTALRFMRRQGEKWAAMQAERDAAPPAKKELTSDENGDVLFETAA